MSQDFSQLQNSYSKIAVEYGDQYWDELANKPLDRELLDRLAAEVGGSGPICDLGCGPGQIARYLADRGAEAIGVDISDGMVAEARLRNPGIEFKQGDMMALDVEDGAWAGIAAFYSIIHLRRDKVVDALRELKRVLRPGGLLLFAFHVGDEVIHLDEWWDKPVSLDTYFFTADEMQGYLEAAGFEIEDTIERPPYEGVEYPSQRAYIFAREPGD